MKIGNRIRRLRNENSLTQRELADRCDLSKGFISQLERDQTSPSIESLSNILEALGTNLSDFFSAVEEEKIVFSKGDRYVKEDSELGYKIDWVIPNAQKNMMEPIIITVNSKSQFDLHEAHDGEEFGFVLEGKISIILNQKKYIANEGDCFYYSSKCDHVIINDTNKRSRILLVSTPPSF